MEFSVCLEVGGGRAGRRRCCRNSPQHNCGGSPFDIGGAIGKNILEDRKSRFEMLSL